MVFLFCATAFGVVLTLGGLRYATVETEIYLLTTDLLDLQAAAALSVLQLVVVVGLLVRRPAAARRRPTATCARSAAAAAPARPRRRTGALAGAPALLLVLRARRRSLTLVAGSLRVDDGWGLDNYRALTTTGDATQALLVPVTDALVNSLRTAVDATWMALSLGLLVALVVTRRSHGRAPSAGSAAALDGVLHAAARGLGGDPRLRLPDHPRRAAARPARLARCWCRSPRRWWRCRSSCAPSRRCWPASTTGSARPPRRSGPRRCGPLLTVDLPVVWKPLLAAAGFAFAVSLGEFGATSFLARDDAPDPAGGDLPAARPPRRAQLRHGAGRLRACSPPPPPLVMLAVERLRVPSVGAF